MDTSLMRSLAFCLAAMPAGRRDWWLIGSGALSLMGVDTSPADLDLLTTGEGGLALMTALGTEPDTKSPDDRFRSKIFKSLKVPGGLNVEIMGNLEVNGPDGWQLLRPETRMAIDTHVGTVFVPEAAEMVQILTSFGRPKDMDRAQKLRELMAVRGQAI